jgi:hypothetical protein
LQAVFDTYFDERTIAGANSSKNFGDDAVLAILTVYLGVMWGQRERMAVPSLRKGYPIWKITHRLKCHDQALPEVPTSQSRAQVPDPC